MSFNNYNIQETTQQMLKKKKQIMILREQAFCMVKEHNGQLECIKNRHGNVTISDCLKYQFEKVKLSQIDSSMTFADLNNKYYGKNIWLMIDE